MITNPPFFRRSVALEEMVGEYTKKLPGSFYTRQSKSTNLIGIVTIPVRVECGQALLCSILCQ
jgi:hypothetical protein